MVKPSRPEQVKVLVWGHSFIDRVDRADLQLQLGSGFKLYVRGIRGAKAGTMEAVYRDIVKRLQPHVVILDLGSNDLCAARCKAPGFAARMRELVCNIAACGVTGVVLLPVQRRKKQGILNCDRMVTLYNVKVREYNDSVAELLAREPQVAFWRHEKKLDLAPDGIHLDDTSQDEYAKCIGGLASKSTEFQRVKLKKSFF